MPQHAAGPRLVAQRRLRQALEHPVSRRFRTSLVTVQIALSMMLLIAAGLFIKSLRNVSRVDLGIEVERVVQFAVAPMFNGYEPARSRAFFARVEEELAVRPGVTSVSATAIALFTRRRAHRALHHAGVARRIDTRRGRPGFCATEWSVRRPPLLTSMSTNARPRTASKHPERRAARRAQPPGTLAVDIGGSALKGSVVDATGALLADRQRVSTPRPCTPARLVEATLALARALPKFDRASVGFPGVVDGGVVYTAPNLGNEAFCRFDATTAFEESLGVPVRVINDADMHGLGVIRGTGVEVVLTLGSGVGTALFLDGRPGPHLGFVAVRKGEAVNDLGTAGFDRLGPRKWSKRVQRLIDSVRELTNFDHVYLGGGNADRLEIDLPHDVSIVSNHAALLGAVRVWELESGRLVAPHVGR